MLNAIDLSRIDLNLLVVFETVMETGNVARAAGRLNLSPSAVSHALVRLRQLLQDPLFLRTPRGVVPTEKAAGMAAPIGEILARVRVLMASAEPFDPATSRRRFTIGAPDGVSAVLVAPLLEELNSRAPHIHVGLRQLLPAAGEAALERAWRPAFADLEARSMDVAIIPGGAIPPRFHRAPLYEEDFVIAARAGHRFIRQRGLDHYCASGHLVVSLMGDAHGFVDEALARLGRTRRVVLTVPDFMFALAVLAETDLLCALPRRFVGLYAPRFKVVAVEPPLALGTFSLNAVCLGAAAVDPGLRWLVAMLQTAGRRKRAKPD